jgi:hypothetical protein
LFVKEIWGSLRRALTSRAGVLMVAVVSLLLLGGGVAVPVWMSTLPAIASCTYLGSGSICDYHTSPLDQRWVGLLLAAAGVGLLAVAWRFDRWTGQRPRHGWSALRSWGAPLLWLAIIPVVAGPATYLIAGSSVNGHSCKAWSNPVIPVGGADCPALVFLPSVVIPGLAASLDVLHSLGPTISWDFGFLLPALPPPQQAALAFGTVIWLSSIIALLVIAKLPVPAEARAEPTAEKTGARNRA